MTNEAKWPTQAEIFNAFERAAKAKGNPLAGAQAVADLCLDCANVPYKLDQRAAWIDGLEAALWIVRNERGDGYKAERAIEAKIKDVRESMAQLRPAERGSPTLPVEALAKELRIAEDMYRANGWEFVCNIPDLKMREQVKEAYRRMARRAIELLQSQPVPTSAYPAEEIHYEANVARLIEQCGRVVEWMSECKFDEDDAAMRTDFRIAVEAAEGAQKRMDELHPAVASAPASPSSFGESLTKLAEMEEKATPDRIAVIQAHRATHAAEHDPANGKLHGYCIVCGVPFPCAYVGEPPASPPEIRAALGRSGEGDSHVAHRGKNAVDAVIEHLDDATPDDCTKLRELIVRAYGDREKERARADELMQHRKRQTHERAEPGERDAAMEEAAKVCDEEPHPLGFFHTRTANYLAARIRSLKYTPASPAPTDGRAETADLEVDLQSRISAALPHLQKIKEESGSANAVLSGAISAGTVFGHVTQAMRKLMEEPAPSASGETKGEVKS